jgi:hypothetical protein
VGINSLACIAKNTKNPTPKNNRRKTYPNIVRLELLLIGILFMDRQFISSA